jgi:hypothetical protein
MLALQRRQQALVTHNRISGLPACSDRAALVVDRLDIKPYIERRRESPQSPCAFSAATVGDLA